MADTERLHESTERLATRTEKMTEINPAAERRKDAGQVFVDEAVMAKMFCKFLRVPAALAVLLMILVSAADSWHSQRSISALETDLEAMQSAATLGAERVTEMDNFRGQASAEALTRVRDLEGSVDKIRTALASVAKSSEDLAAQLRGARDDWRDVAAQQALETAARNDLMRGVTEMLHELRGRPGLTSQ